MALLLLRFVVALSLVACSLQATKDPLNDFCRRFGHQTTGMSFTISLSRLLKIRLERAYSSSRIDLSACESPIRAIFQATPPKPNLVNVGRSGFPLHFAQPVALNDVLSLQFLQALTYSSH